ncbi:hypothetical protein V6N13_148884 [Hibiscus sabdariffa]|uniref:UDP-glycosyltransferases domain-containing protein n=1 Tax=Hibiscus sabdariffa TaxID=183260 RepID=A0ABR2EKQ6_9ROSI
MGSLSEQPHFVLFPFKAQGHLLPMVDIGRLLAQRGVIVTIITTPHNAGRVQKSIARSIESGHPISLVQLRFPDKEVGFPEGVENVALVQSMFKVPRIYFNGFRCFCLLCSYNIHSSKILETTASDSEYFTVSGLTEKVQFLLATKKSQTRLKEVTRLQSMGISTVKRPELIELGLGLEASNKPFIWVLRGNNTSSNEVEEWMEEDGFEERTKGRGLVVKGWAPQVLILSPPAIGGFLTHCGWNSTMEGISAGVPLITLPFLADQFSNEKLAVQVLKIGVSLGIEKPTNVGDEKSGFLLKKEEVRNAIQQLMDDGNEGLERRRAKEFGEKAKKAVEVDVQDAIHQSQNMCSN